MRHLVIRAVEVWVTAAVPGLGKSKARRQWKVLVTALVFPTRRPNRGGRKLALVLMKKRFTGGPRKWFL